MSLRPSGRCPFCHQTLRWPAAVADGRGGGIQLPIGREAQFEGVIDLVRMCALRFDEAAQGAEVVVSEVPADLAAEARAAREHLVESLANHCAFLGEKWLVDAAGITEDDLHRALREVTLAGKATPVLCGASVRNKGVQPVIDAVIRYLPSPDDMPAVQGSDPHTGKPTERRADPKEHFCALAFKTATDIHGELTYLRVYSGRINTKDQVTNPRANKPERVSRIFQMHANERLPVDYGGAGEIVAVIGLKHTVTGDTLCDPRHRVVLERMEFPETVISMAIEPKLSADRDKLNEVLAKMAKDDPTFNVRADDETGQIIVSGMGELHLEIVKSRMLREFNVAANVGEPRVAYKETVLAAGEAEGHFERKTGDKTQAATVRVRVEPNPEAMAVKVELQVPPEEIPRQYQPTVEAALKSAATSGAAMGYPMIQVRAAVVGGRYNPAEATDTAYEAAANLAFRNALQAVGCAILEPIMKFDITVPEEYLGEVLNDLNRRRAEISDVEVLGTLRSVKGTVPIAEMFGYATSLRSLSQGRGSYTLEPHRYRPIPEHLRKKLFGDLEL